jgi:tetratricopeptide (TPR) repeat protein
MTLSGGRVPKIRIRLWKKICFAALMTTLFFVALEVVLVAFGFRTDSQFDDPLVGFSNRIPLMEKTTDERGENRYITARNKLRWFNEQSFPAKKATNAKRVFCMGGSTTYGHPFSDSTSFAGWLRAYLPAVDPDPTWEVINAGGISYASYRVAALMEELAQYEPDLFIVYSVHNEFLERRTYANLFDTPSYQLQSQAWLSGTRTWSLANQWIRKFSRSPSNETINAASKKELLSAEVDEILNHTIGPVNYHRDDEWRANVMRHYEINLRRMVTIARNAGARIVFISPTANEKNCSPFKSELDPKLSDNALDALNSIQKRAVQDPNAQQPEGSLAYLQAAIEIDPTYAEYQFRAGQDYFALQQYPQALTAFRNAIQSDVCPLRAIEEVRSALERVSSDTQTPLVDFESRLRAHCRLEHGHEIFGEEYFLDHVHPTIDVNRWLALWILEELQSKKWLRGEPVLSPKLQPQLSSIEQEVLAGLDHRAHGVAHRNLAKVLHWAGKFDEAIPRARDALNALNDDPESRYVLADCLKNRGQYDESLSEFETLFSNGKDYARGYEPFGHLLAELGRFEQAKAYLLLATLHNDKSTGAFYLLGLVHLELGEYEFALESLTRAAELSPNDLAVRYYLAIAQQAMGQSDDADRSYQFLIAAGASSSELHFRYAQVLLEQNKWNQAILELESALRLDPDWLEAQDTWMALVQGMRR